MLACRGRGERLWRWLHPLRVTQQCRLASVAAWLSSTGISHHHLLPHIPPIRLSTVNGSPRPGTAPQCLNFSSQAPGLQETRAPARLMCGCCKDYPLLIPFRLPRISCFTLSLKCSSSDSDNCPAVGIRPLPQFPDSPWAGPVLPTLPLPPPGPSPHRVLCGSVCILSRCSGPPGGSQLVLCMHVGVGSCIPDASVERDVLHAAYSSATLLSLYPCIFLP